MRMIDEKRKILMAILVAIIATTVAHSQVKLGLTGGLRFDRLEHPSYNNSSILGDNHEMNGYYLGLKLDVNSPVGFGFDFGVNFCNRDVNNDNKWGMEVPIDLKYNINILPVFSPYLLLGISCYSNFEDLCYYPETWEHDESWFDRVEYALNLGGGVTIAKHIQLGATYQIPLGTYYYRYNEFDKSPAGKRAKSWVLSFTYLF